MYSVYLIESLKDGRYYIGQTNNLGVRLNDHNRDKCKYTKNRGPWFIKAYKQFDSRSEAMKEERRIKKLKNRQAIEAYFGIET
jgi:putative endonuclease